MSFLVTNFLICSIILQTGEITMLVVCTNSVNYERDKLLQISGHADSCFKPKTQNSSYFYTHHTTTDLQAKKEKKKKKKNPDEKTVHLIFNSP